MGYIGAILRGFRSLLTGLGITGREIGGKSVTLTYPHEEPELSDAFRSVIQLVRFDETDVVRHPLVQQIIRAYDRHATARRNHAGPEASDPPRNGADLDAGRGSESS